MTDPKSEPSERAAFESKLAVILHDNPNWRESAECAIAWYAWQARAALTPAPAQPEPLRPVALCWRCNYPTDALRCLHCGAQPEPPALWCKHCGEGTVPGLCRNKDAASSTCHASKPEPPTAAGVEPAGWQLVPTTPYEALLRPFHSCPPDELPLAWNAALRVAEVMAKKINRQATPHTLTDAQALAIYEALNRFLTVGKTKAEFCALIRAAAAGAG